jgi:hypothetical protein
MEAAGCETTRVHHAAYVKKWVERMRIDLEDHPSFSPDLNPIEHIWVHPKRALHKRYPDIANTPGNLETVKYRLAEVLPEVWWDIPESVFEACWKSMPDRVQLLLTQKGGTRVISYSDFSSIFFSFVS